MWFPQFVVAQHVFSAECLVFLKETLRLAKCCKLLAKASLQNKRSSKK